VTEAIEKTLALLEEGTLPVMLPLILCALTSAWIVAERVLYLYGQETFLSWVWPPARRRLSRLRRDLSDRVETYLARPTPQARDDVIELCAGCRNPYTAYVARVIGEHAFIRRGLQDLYLGAAARYEEIRIQKGLEFLSTVSKAAPLLGLLGTVIGMIQTFRVMMLGAGSDPRALSAGISIALIATEVGLAVSLPGVVATSWLHRRAHQLSEEIHLVSMRIRQAGQGRSGRMDPEHSLRGGTRPTASEEGA
jgi:biopolymer transport protein ExbB/TolQ